MELFDELRKKSSVDWNSAYSATPKFYRKPDGSCFGAIALTEGIDTVLSKTLQNKYAVNGKQISDWKMVLVSITKDSVIGECDYFSTLKKLEKYTLDSNNDAVLIRGLSLEEIESIKE